jgi:predicted dehydrogenase
MSNEVRLGVVGLGNIGLQHINNVMRGLVPRCHITAVCSRNLHPIANEISAKHFCDAQQLIDSELCDAVLVAAPNRYHPIIGKSVLRHGLHLLMEKPIGMSAYEGEQLINMTQQNQVFALMLNQRTDPVFVKMKKLIDAGELGTISRTHWTMTHWFRPEVYFQASDWRATWHTDGGGLLLNQCVHNLDIFQWLAGMPIKLHGFCNFGKYHDIEVDDEATAYLEYQNGATGVFVGSTGEAPGVNRLDIVGDKATLSYNGEALIFKKNTTPTAEYSRTTHDMFGMPSLTQADITPRDKMNQHAVIMTNFVDAIIDSTPLIAPAPDGLASVNLANAIVQSAWDDKPVEFPFDTLKYHQALQQRRQGAQLRKKSDIDVVIDMNKSFR